MQELIGDKPVIVVNTHCHGDHTLGNFEFDRVYCHEYDADSIRAQMTPDAQARFAPKEGAYYKAEDLVTVLFGQAFLPGAAVLKILAPLVLIRGCGDLLCYQAIISAGKENLLIGARVWAGLANIVLNGLLIPRFGCGGAALASLLSELVVNGILLPQGLRLGKPKISE